MSSSAAVTHSDACPDCDNGSGTVRVSCCGYPYTCTDLVPCHCTEDMPEEMCAECRALDFANAALGR